MKKISLQILIIAAIGFVFNMAGTLSAEPEDAAPSGKYEFLLKPKSDGMQLFMNLDMRGTGTAFIKEPFFKSRRIVRNSFPIKGNPLPFAWDQGAGKLYLDFNRNRDLTDDPNNVFEARAGDSNRYQHFFDNVPIEVMINDTPVTYYVLIQLSHSHSYFGYFHLKNSWEGEIDLPHIKARMSVVDDLNGELEVTDKAPGYSSNDSYGFIPFDFKDHPTSYPVESFSGWTSRFLNKNIFLNGRAYELDYEFVKSKDEVLVKASFMETFPDMGTLRFEGDYIKEAFLDGGHHAFLYSPSKEEKIPAGSYRSGALYVQKDPASQAMRAALSDFSFKAGEEYVIKAGGPLRNKVSISRRGRRLYLSYELVGNGGEAYHQYDYNNPPRFAVFQGDKKIFSDKFAFG